jgi:hypothetical protein
MADVFQDLKKALEAAAKTPRGRRAVEGHDEDFEIEVAGHAPIHLEIKGGRMTVNKGPSPRQEPLHFTRLQLDETTLHAILEGRMSPVDAMEAGKLFLRTRLYGGALGTILLRSAYDLARERKLNAA